MPCADEDRRCEGTHRPDFALVREAFDQNFAEGDLGASCAVVYRGELVVDLWGGHRDVAARQPWQRDTIVNVWSVTKMMTALTVLMLHDRGELSVDAPLAAYWPEFGGRAKDGILVRHVLGHTAGIPGFDPAVDEESMYDWERCCENLAAQAPWWKPGTASGYHSSTQGYLLGELVRRVTGRTLGTTFREEVARPLGADFHIGLPDSEFDRVAEMRTAECSPLGQSETGETSPVALRVNRGEPDQGHLVNTDRWRRFEQPASNGHGNARSVARVLSCLASSGAVDGVELLSPPTIERVFEVQADGRDLVLGHDVRFGIGYGLNCPGMPLGLNDRTCFWAGWGGSLAVVDVENRLVAAYVMNRMRSDTAGGLRGARVVFAAHEAAEAGRAAA